MPLLRYLALCLLLATAAAAVSGNGDADISIPRACATPEASKYPFCEPGRSIDERVEDLLGRLKLEEKPALLIARMSPDGGVDRLGLPEYNWGTNCMHGVESWCGKVMTGKDDNNDGVEDHYLICPSSFPSPNSLGSSFNMSLVQDVASLTALELRALWLLNVGEATQWKKPHPDTLPHVGLDCWAPNINLQRDPRWGRNMEVPSEDPYINGRYGVAFTGGMQKGHQRGVAHDMLKAHLEERLQQKQEGEEAGKKDVEGMTLIKILDLMSGGRSKNDEGDNSNATALNPLEDDPYYLAVVTLKHWAAYSLENKVGTDITRRNFNAIVSDYDLASSYFPAFKTSVMEGKARGVMCSYNRVNGVPSCANEFLLQDTLRDTWGFDGYVSSDSTAVSYIYTPHNYSSSMLEAVVDAIEAGTDVNSFLHGTHHSTGGPYLDHLQEAVEKGLLDEKVIDQALRRTLKLRFELGLFDPVEKQPLWHVPPSVINNKQTQSFNLQAAKQTLVLLRNDNGMLPLVIDGVNDDVVPKASNGRAGGDRSSEGAEGDEDGVFTIAMIGPHANATLAMLGNYIGQICPHEGELKDYSCIPSPYLAMSQLVKRLSSSSRAVKVVFEEGCDVRCNSTEGFDAAISAAKQADFVVVLVGLDRDQEGEAHDRATIDLPGFQQDLAMSAIKLGKPTTVVLINGGQVAIDQIAQYSNTDAGEGGDVAIIEAFCPGFMGGHAIAETIFGLNNPSGKLPVTIYPANFVNQIDITEMSMTAYPGRGYRYYLGEKIGAPALYPFGYGLSYTTFHLTLADPRDQHSFPANEEVIIDLESGREGKGEERVESDAPAFTAQFSCDDDDDTKVESVTAYVTNTGSMDGDEVLFAFFSPVVDTIEMEFAHKNAPHKPNSKHDSASTKGESYLPFKQLFHFDRQHVPKQQTTSFTIPMTRQAFTLYDSKGQGVCAPGVYTITVTNGVDESVKGRVTVVGKERMVVPFPTKQT